MITEAAQNIIDYIKDILNERNKIVERYKRNVIESEENMGKEKYRDLIKDGCQNNFDESRHTIEN